VRKLNVRKRALKILNATRSSDPTVLQMADLNLNRRRGLSALGDPCPFKGRGLVVVLKSLH